MKALILVSILISSLFAQARSILPAEPIVTITAQLQEFDVNHGYIKNVNIGDVTINSVDGVVTLNLVEKIICQPGMMCIALAPAYTKIELPLIEKYQDDCGSTIYVAEKDMRPVDGTLSNLTVTDHSTIRCRIWHKNQSEVLYSTVHPRSGDLTESYFGGKAFGPTFVLHGDDGYIRLPEVKPFN